MATHLQIPSFFRVSLYCNHLCRVEEDICSTELQDHDDDKFIYKLLNKITIY